MKADLILLDARVRALKAAEEDNSGWTGGMSWPGHQRGLRKRGLMACVLVVAGCMAGMAQHVTDKVGQTSEEAKKNLPNNPHNPPGKVPKKCLACPTMNGTPYATPDVLNIQGLPIGSLTLQGPIITSPAEPNQAGWATKIIQANTNLTPDPNELSRLSQPLDLLFGEPLTDATWQSPEPATRVKNPSVILKIPVSYTGTGLQETGPDYECGGPVCVPEYISDGLYGVFMARVEDCLSTSDRPTVPAVKGNNGNPVACSTADGIPGNNGFWYDIAPVWGAVTNLSFAPIAKASTDTVTGTLTVPVKLPAPANSVRVEVAFGLQDDLKTGWIGSLYWGSVSQAGPYSGPEHALTRVALQLPTITVLPAAFIQAKILPYTIVYRPPGDQSSGTYTATQAYGTSMTTGNNTTIDNTETFEQSFDVKDDAKVTALIATAELADDNSNVNTSNWDRNTVIGTGLTVSGSHTTVRSFTVGSATTDPSILPASSFVTPNTCNASNYTAATCTVNAGETYAQQPFWADRIVVLLNPQFALWDFNATPAMQLLGASDFDEVTIKDLDACISNTNQNAWRLANGQFLTPAECKALATLDPFYGTGQSFSPVPMRRGVEVGSGSYGRDALNPGSTTTTKFSDIFNYQTSQTTSVSATYAATITDVIGFSWSAGLTLAYQQGMYGLNAGFSAGTTLTQGEKSTTGESMKVTYAASTIATYTNATEIDGAFGDDHDFYTPDCQQDSGKCYHPSVKVYIDELFGSYMFQDEATGCNPKLAVCSLKKKYIPTK